MFFKKKKTMAKRTSYAIIGLGKFGAALSRNLAEAGADLLLIDTNEEHIRNAREFSENALILNALDEKALAEAGVQNCDIAVVCIAEHLDTSILITLNLVNLGVKKVIAKATSAAHGVILEKLGAEVVYPERDMAIRLGNRLANSGMLDVVQLSEQINISKMIVPKSFVGKKVSEVNPRAVYGINIIAIENNEKVYDFIRPDYIFKAGNILYVSGSSESIQKLCTADN